MNGRAVSAAQVTRTRAAAEFSHGLEIQETPLSSFGALAGIASFAFVLLTVNVQPGASNGVPHDAVGTAVAFVKLALIVPGLAFFFAFISNLFLSAGLIRGACIGAILLLVSCVLSGAGGGVLLANLPRTALSQSIEIAGVSSMGVSLMLAVANALVFGGVVGEAIYAKLRQMKLEGIVSNSEEDADDNVAVVIFTLLFSAIPVLLLAVVIEFILQASLGLPSYS